MNAAEIILSLLGVSRVAIELVEKWQRGDLTDEELQAAWETMQTRLTPVSGRISSFNRA